MKLDSRLKPQINPENSEDFQTANHLSESGTSFLLGNLGNICTSLLGNWQVFMNFGLFGFIDKIPRW